MIIYLISNIFNITNIIIYLFILNFFNYLLLFLFYFSNLFFKLFFSTNIKKHILNNLHMKIKYIYLYHVYRRHIKLSNQLYQ